METHDLTAENYGKNTESPLQLVKLGYQFTPWRGLREGVGTVVLPFRAEKALLSET
jgi:hypothetical protein